MPNSNSISELIKIDIMEPEKYPSEKESVVIFENKRKRLRAIGVFYDFIYLRSSKKIVYPTKIFLAKFLNIKSQHTLNKYLKEYEEIGLIKMEQKFAQGQSLRTVLVISFPLTETAAPIEFSGEKKPIHIIFVCGDEILNGTDY